MRKKIEEILMGMEDQMVWDSEGLEHHVDDILDAFREVIPEKLKRLDDKYGYEYKHKTGPVFRTMFTKEGGEGWNKCIEEMEGELK